MYYDSKPAIYKITNKVNGKIYVGCTIKPVSTRWADHIYEAEHQCRYVIHKAIKKYGLPAFTFEVVSFPETVEQMYLDEAKLITELGTHVSEFGYNLSPGGESGFTGRQHSEETKAKISASKVGHQSPRRKLSAAKVIAIRQAAKPTRELARQYQVDPQVIRNIRQGKTYKEIGGN